MAAFVLAMAIIGSKLVFNHEQKTMAQAPTVMILPPRVIRVPGVEQAPASVAAGQSTTQIDTPPTTTDSSASAPQAAVVASPPAVAAPAASPTVPVHVPQRVEQRIELKMQSADPNGLGLTHEQFAEAFPHLYEHFDQIDSDHDGRVTAQELMAAWERFWAKSAQDTHE
jgi:hypothetical protein